MTVAAETSTLRSRRRPRSRAHSPTRSVPYLLILPAIVVITAILGYPLYKLVTLSFQQYGLAELIQRKGVWIGFDNFASVLRDDVFWDVLLRTMVFTVANVGLTIVLGTLIALLLVKRVGLGACALDRGPRARLVDARRRRRPGLVLDDELPERDPQPRPDRARARRLQPARLVRDVVLASSPWSPS